MCGWHWRMVPRVIQCAVWANYRRGQCDDKRPSRAWHVAADAAIGYVAVKDGQPLRIFEATALRVFGFEASSDLHGNLVVKAV